MTRERGSLAESKNCEILLRPTADRRFVTKVKCPTGRASFWVKFPTVQRLTRVKCPGIAQGGWAVLELTGTLRNRKHVLCFYRVIQTRVEVWENKKCCGNTSRRRVFPQLFQVLPNFHECLYNSIETRSACFLKTGRFA